MAVLFFESIKRNGDVVRLSTTLFNERIDSMFSVLHYYNDIKFTKWPFFLSIGMISFIIGLLLVFSKFSFGIWALLFGVVSLCGYLFGWFDELQLESRLLGKHTKKIKSALLCGFFLFLCSEATLFAGFFWSLLDRIFAASSFISFTSFPCGLERIEWYRDPLRATFVLVASGYMANLAYYQILDKDRYASDFFWGLAIVFGLCFLYIQYKEYCHLHNDIRDSVWYSHMYVLTGFHGVHVIVGLLFLSYRFSSFEEGFFLAHVINVHSKIDVALCCKKVISYVIILITCINKEYVVYRPVIKSNFLKVRNYKQYLIFCYKKVVSCISALLAFIKKNYVRESDFAREMDYPVYYHIDYKLMKSKIFKFIILIKMMDKSFIKRPTRRKIHIILVGMVLMFIGWFYVGPLLVYVLS